MSREKFGRGLLSTGFKFSPVELEVSACVVGRIVGWGGGREAGLTVILQRLVLRTREIENRDSVSKGLTWSCKLALSRGWKKKGKFA